jgi:transposase-like protein
MVSKYSAKLTNEQRKEMVKLYLESELSLMKVAEVYNVSNATVLKWVRKLKSELGEGE